MTATQSILSKVRRTAFQTPPLLIPFALTGTQIHTLRDNKCRRCGEPASRAEFRLAENRVYRYCGVCR